MTDLELNTITVPIDFDETGAKLFTNCFNNLQIDTRHVLNYLCIKF